MANHLPSITDIALYPHHRLHSLPIRDLATSPTDTDTFLRLPARHPLLYHANPTSTFVDTSAVRWRSQVLLCKLVHLQVTVHDSHTGICQHSSFVLCLCSGLCLSQCTT